VDDKDRQKIEEAENAVDEDFEAWTGANTWWQRTGQEPDGSTYREVKDKIYQESRGQDVAELRNIASHANRRKTSRTRTKRQAREQEDRDG
jgi:hypothetical protein